MGHEVWKKDALMSNSGDLGFTASVRGAEIIIFHHGRKATTLRGMKAAEFRDDLERLPADELQELMARLTGNYRHGNERTARNHPRNRR